MEKKMVDIQLESEHGMPPGMTKIIYSKLKEFIGEVYNNRQLSDVIREFSKSETVQKNLRFLYTSYVYNATLEKTIKLLLPFIRALGMLTPSSPLH